MSERESLFQFVRRHAQAKRIEAALHSWQQTADAQEMELAALRRIRDDAERVINSFDLRPTTGCVRDVGGLAEGLRRYRLMRDGAPKPNAPSSQAAKVPRG